jgi:excisionase family DNA binding protein
MKKGTLLALVDNDRLNAIEETLKALLERLDTLPKPNDTMNAKEAAAYLKLSMATLYEKTSKGKIPYLKSGGSLIFSRSELENWLRAGRPDLMNEVIDNLNSNH